jgi:hypothetical protein
MAQFAVPKIGLESVLAAFTELARRSTRAEVLDKRVDMRDVTPIDIEDERGHRALLKEASGSGDVAKPIHLGRTAQLRTSLRQLERIEQPILRAVAANNLQHRRHG